MSCRWLGCGAGGEEGIRRDPLFGVKELSEIGEHLLLLVLVVSFLVIRMYVASAER